MPPPLSSPGTSSRAHEQILDAVVALDGDRLRDVVLRYADQHGHDALVVDVLVPTLRRIGVMWERGRLGVMHEHLASSIVRSAIGQLTRPVRATGLPKVVLSCPPGELHDLPLHMFALMLVERHLDPLVLGADTPIPAIAQTARAVTARACVVATVRPRAILAYRGALERLSENRPVFVAGPVGAAFPASRTLGLLPHDWREAADIVAGA